MVRMAYSMPQVFKVDRMLVDVLEETMPHVSHEVAVGILVSILTRDS